MAFSVQYNIKGIEFLNYLFINLGYKIFYLYFAYFKCFRIFAIQNQTLVLCVFKYLIEILMSLLLCVTHKQ